MRKEEKCLFTGCEKDHVSRGLCQTHYHNVLCHVRAGRTTWAKLEKAGKTLPAKRARNGVSKIYKDFLGIE